MSRPVYSNCQCPHCRKGTAVLKIQESRRKIIEQETLIKLDQAEIDEIDAVYKRELEDIRKANHSYNPFTRMGDWANGQINHAPAPTPEPPKPYRSIQELAREFSSGGYADGKPGYHVAAEPNTSSRDYWNDPEDVPKLTTKQIMQNVTDILAKREQNYNKPDKNFQAIADVWTPLILTAHPEIPITVRLDVMDVSRFMVVMKMVRDAHSYKDDNWDDSIGYSAIGRKLGEDRKKK